MQYIKGGAKGIGIYYDVLDANKKDLPLYQLIVIDEAHRIPHEPNSQLSQLDSVLYSANTVVCLIDEKQALNPDDNGNLNILKDRWRKLFKDCPILEYKMDEQYRLPVSYSGWIDSFISGKYEKFNFGDYDLQVASNESDAIKYLQQKSNDGFSCGILASYTKCNGRNGNDLRIPSLGVKWLMKTEDYNIWWREKNIRHRFDKCASVYGCQGFELDYAALFWGNDLCFSLSKEGFIEFFICQRNDITDDIGQAYGKKFRTRVKEALLTYNERDIHQVITDLKNRYRILLSRAKKGLIIFFENTIAFP